MSKRVRLTDDSLNSYGARVITAGMDIAQYERNPVLLYMHERGRVIGYMKNIERDDGGVTAEPVFDCASDLSRQCKKQWEFGSLKMVSVGLDILELSEDKKLLVEGQTCPTITKSRLYEVSVVDIGANDNAIVLRHEGKQITLGQGSDNPLPQLSNNLNKKEEMELSKLALTLGLPATATEDEVNAEVAKLTASRQKVAELEKQNAEMQQKQITAAVDAAVAANKITADKKAQFVELGKKVGIDDLNATLAAMSPMMKLSQTINPAQQTATQTAAYGKLSEVPASELMELRSNNPKEYMRLYKEEYGMECSL